MFVQRVEALRLTTPEEDLAHRLKPGDRVVLVKMDNDPRPVPPGTQGTVERVNWIHRDRGEAQVMVSWDTGSRLMVLVPEDRIELVGSFLRRRISRRSRSSSRRSSSSTSSTGTMAKRFFPRRSTSTRSPRRAARLPRSAR